MNKWTEDARVVFMQLVSRKKKTKIKKFRFDQFISDSVSKGRLDEPTHPNHVGGLAIWAQKEGIIKWTGNVHASKNLSSHGSIVKVWSVL